MNFKSKITLAAIAAVSTVASLASAQQACELDKALDDVPLASEQAPLSCQLNGAVAEAFARIDPVSGLPTLFCDLIDPTNTASFADSIGYTADGDRVSFCQAIDTNPNRGVRGQEDNPAQCADVARQDLAIEFNEGS